MKDTVTILIVSIAAAILMGVPLIIIIWPNYILMGYVLLLVVGISVGPITAYTYLEQRRIDDMEIHFPAFLRELSESKRAGVNLPNSIMNAARIDYGALTEEVRKMGNQLSWGVPLPKVLKMFQKRTEKSQYVNRSMAIVLESYYGGGDIAATMEAIANSVGDLKEVEKERNSILSEQVLIIYSIHFIFVAIIIAMYKIMLPLIAVQGTSGAGLFSSVASAPSTDYFKILFFLTLTIQSVANGLVAGEAKEGSLSAGLKHTLIMLSVAIFGYTTFILPTSVNVTANIRNNQVFPGGRVELFGNVDEENTRVAEASIIVSLLDEEVITVTDENGEYTTSITAPTISGVYTLSVTAIYENTEKTIEREIFVTSP
ncbi:hypothetical protein COT72_02620 [archaeon CG10_big_fil_rev_8_21_14_0_10_43_11]|nr:MAG: hypothetical protein COT72_02620 [archaeon CG10_big_fil_rev_8_21_14_0_10_43_11]